MKNIPTTWLRDRVRSSPNRIAVEFEEKTLTFRELYDKAAGLAKLIDEKYTDCLRIAIFMKNSIDTIITIHAITLLTKELVIINARLNLEEVEYQLKKLNVSLLITSEEYSEKFEDLKFLDQFTIINDQLDKYHKDDNSIYEFAEIHPEDTLCYVYTSGTTGNPKAVKLTYSNFYFSAISSMIRLGTITDDIWLLIMPMYHLGGLSIIFRTCIYGTQILAHAKFDPDKIVADIKTKRVTQISLVPTMLKRILPKIDQPFSLRFLLIGGAKTPDTLIKRCLEKELPIALTYGMTETCSQIATATPKQVRTKPGTAGKPLIHSEIIIFDPDEHGVGEIGVKGPSVTQGYFEEDTPFRDGYLLTGDLGFIDEENDVTVLQRRRDLIISGGENIYPSEIEQRLLELEEIEEVCVIPKNDPEWGQIPVAILVLSDNLTKKKIIDYLKPKLASYKLPKIFYQTDVLPKTASGKIKRSEVNPETQHNLKLIN